MSGAGFNTYQRTAVHDRHSEKIGRKEQRREERAVRRQERAAAGQHGCDVDWGAAVNRVTDTPYEGVVRTLARGPAKRRRHPGWLRRLLPSARNIGQS
jgi:hypothetical protein